ncbi:MAG TPA: transglycosylase SLT domain-containing protein, partial [Vicinamibacterales bacterium]|nr:transglycosylase SLT domain-containing protein [Vicinamibacterales bacterium]
MNIYNPRGASIALALTFVLSPPPAVPVSDAQGKLTPTAHAVLPDDPSDLWLVPSESDRSARGSAQYEPLAEAVKRYQDEDYEGAARLAAQPSLAGTPLAGYALYYRGLSHLRQQQFDEARRVFDRLLDSKQSGHLAGAALLASGEAAEAAGDLTAAFRTYSRLAGDKQVVNDEILARLGRLALAVGDRTAAAEAYVRLYYEFPLTVAGAEAATQMELLKNQFTRRGYESDLGRNQILFGARRYAEARAGFSAIRDNVSGDDRELADLRIAESDFQLKNYAAARDRLRPYVARSSRLAEARFFFLSAIKELGDDEEYVTLTRALVADFPDSSWSEEALNNLGTHYILENEDEAAAQTFRELYAKFPNGTRAERAAWKYGWWTYRTSNHAETIQVFESASSTFPRSDYRPSFLYWSARAHARKGSATDSTARMRLVHTDYANSYYGRLAEGHLRRAGLLPKGDRPRTASSQAPAVAAPAIPNDAMIRLLLATGLYDDAFNELRYAQRVSGHSPVIDATIAWAYHQKGELRRAITMMRRAYPQFLTAGGQKLPPQLLQVIFPLTYWPLIQKHAAAHKLDPYMVAALIAQESTFDHDIRSPANAWGLMQVVPATGRRIARQIGIRGFQTSSLTHAETNIRIGTYYFARLVERFGGTHYALASYNAGENRIVRWRAERPGM